MNKRIFEQRISEGSSSTRSGDCCHGAGAVAGGMFLKNSPGTLRALVAGGSGGPSQGARAVRHGHRFRPPRLKFRPARDARSVFALRSASSDHLKTPTFHDVPRHRLSTVRTPRVQLPSESFRLLIAGFFSRFCFCFVPVALYHSTHNRKYRRRSDLYLSLFSTPLHKNPCRKLIILSCRPLLQYRQV